MAPDDCERDHLAVSARTIGEREGVNRHSGASDLVLVTKESECIDSSGLSLWVPFILFLFTWPLFWGYF